MTLHATLHGFFKEHGIERTYWIAYSGGMDSHVLLDLCVKLREEYSLLLKVVHVNHGLHQEAALWVSHCQQICDDYQVDFLPHALSLNIQAGESVEERARESRYQFFASCVQQDDMLLTAHHLDDQAETMLIQLLRGSGPKGLSSMPNMKSFFAGYHARPFLNASRSELLSYANQNKLTWIHDDSNQNVKFTRNFLRHEILPLLQSRWPNAASAISRSAAYCAEAQGMAEEYADQLLSQLAGSRKGVLSVAKLLQLSDTKKKFVLRSWIESRGYTLPDTRRLNSILTDVLHAKWDRMPLVAWLDVSLRRYRDDLYLVQNNVDHAPSEQYSWDLSGELHLPLIGKLVVSEQLGAGLSSDVACVEVGFRSGLQRSTYQHRLKHIYQACGIPPWERDRLPIILKDDIVIGIPGYYLDKQYLAQAGEQGKMIHLVCK